MSEYDGRQFVGIDLHRRRTVIVRQSETGEHLETRRIVNDPIALAREIGKAGLEPEVVLEATYGWYWAADVLAENGARVHLAHPLGIKGFTYRRVKNDLLTELSGDRVGGCVRRRSRLARFALVINDGDVPRELSGLVVPRRGSLEATGDLFEPYRLVDGDGAVVVPVAAFFAELAACGRPATTQRSYGMDLLRWFRFLWAIGVGWDQATRVEARDFCRWLQVAVKPTRPHWRYPAAALGIGSAAGCGGGERGDRQAVSG